MKFMIKLMVVGLIIAVLLPFTVLKGKDGKPLMSFSDLKAPDIKVPEVDLPGALPASQPKDSMQGKDVVFQWRDAQGNLHFSSKPPRDGSEYSIKGYDPTQNLIQSVKPKVEAPKVDSVQIKTELPESKADVGSAYSPEKVKQLMDDAKNVEQLLQQRMKQQEALIQ